MNRLSKKTAHKIGLKSLLFVLLFSFGSVFSQNTEYTRDNIYRSWKEFNNSEIDASFDSTGSTPLAVVADQEIGVPNHVSVNPKVYLKLKVKSDVAPFTWTRTTLKVNVEYLLPNGQFDTQNSEIITLQVEYNPNGNSANFIDASQHLALNRHGVRATINEITTQNLDSGGSTNQIPNPNISLEIGFETERYYLLTQQLPSVQHQIFTDVNEVGNAVEAALNLEWQALTGATEYEVEWTWVDRYDDPIINSDGSITMVELDASAIDFSSRDFETNCTRIKTKNLFYEIPLIYSKGYIIYRVRAVGRFLDDVTKIYYGPWSSGTNGEVKVADWTGSYVSVEEHETKKNWQFQSSYAEDGKKKDVVSYFDGSLRNRQTVTKINTNNTAVVGEVVYDNQGRPAIEILPVPLFDKNYIRFFKDLNKNLSNQVYTHLDFDWDNPDTTAVCDSNVGQMNNNSGSSEYYSRNNQFSDVNINYLPEAFNYPFSQIEYTADNTGRIKRKGGVGQTHQLDSGHEMRYYYTSPYQAELNRLFGYSVGYASHYKKNVIIDPNGQVSVSYIDPQGRTIATALKGEAPAGMRDLTTQSGEHQESHTIISVDLLNNNDPLHLDTQLDNNILGTTGAFPSHDDKLTFSKEIVADNNQVGYNFNYKIENSNFFTPDFCNDKYAFVYDLKLTLKDECGFEKFASLPGFAQNVKQIGTYQIGASVNTIDLTTITMDNILNVGSYSLFKELKVNEDVLNQYADYYVSKLINSESGEGCYIPQSNFSSTSVTGNCNPVDCATCETNLGTQEAFVLQNIISHYNNNTFVYTSGANTATFTDSELDYNGEENISQIEVDGMVVALKAYWLTLKDECDQLCGVRNFSASSCTINEDTLLSDVSPKGQYGSDELIDVNTASGGEEIFEITDTMSVFNSVNTAAIYHNNGANSDYTSNDWRSPVTPYVDEFGVESYVEIVSNENTPELDDYLPPILSSAQIFTVVEGGTTIKRVKPQSLAKVTDFIQAWIPSWAKSLLPYHPEFCYLEYSKKLCVNTKPFVIVGSANTNPQNLNSDQYDGYLEYLDTFAKAEAAGFATGGSIIPGKIQEYDPYFLFLNGEDSSIGNLRKEIMNTAIGTNYNGEQVTMLISAYQTTICNSIVACNVTTIPTNLTDDQKNRLWNTYKNYYKSLKTKIKYVFSSLNAKQNGCFNGCIGLDAPSTITNVIGTYTQANDVYTLFYGSSMPAQLCDSAVATNYQTKQKRFIPADYGYNSGISPQAAANELIAQTNYNMYQQTGNCPLLFDLEVFLDNFFLSVPANTNIAANYPINQGLSLALFNSFNAPLAPIAPNSLTSSPEISVNLDSNWKIATFTFTNYTNTLSTTPLILTIPLASSLKWNAYGIQGTEGWIIKDFKQMYFDENNSDLNNLSSLTFAFSVVAVYLQGGVEKQIVLTGTTRAAIGMCGTAQGNTIGQVLDPNVGTIDGTGCNTKYKFREALINLMNDLLDNNSLYSSNVQLNTYTAYTQSFLKDFFNESGTITSTWSYAGNKFGIYKNGNVIFELTPLNVLPSDISNFEGITISPPPNQGSVSNPVTLFYNRINNTTLFSTECEIKEGIQFSCCGSQNNVVPYVTLRKIENNRLTVSTQQNFYHDNIFQPLNVSIPLNQDIDFEFNIVKNNTTNFESITSISEYASVQTKINGVSYPMIFATFNNAGTFQGQPYNTIKNVLSNNQFYGAAFDIDNLFYSFVDNSNNGQVVSTKEFNFNNSNILSTDGQTSLSLTNSSMWNTVTSLSLDGPTQANWVDSHPIYFNDKFEINFKSKLKVTQPLFSYVVAGTTFSYGGFVQLDFQDAANPDAKYVLLYGGINQAANLCTTCIPQTVAPVSCNEKYQEYLANMGLLGGTPIISSITTSADTYSEVEFCANNLGYLVDSYDYYLSVFGITTTQHPHYLTMIQFGDTALNYGYSQIESVINQYKDYIDDFTPSASIIVPYSWKDYVLNVYLHNNSNVCPPAPMPVESLIIPQGVTPCEEMTTLVTSTYLDDSYDAYILSLKNEFKRRYIKEALEKVAEQFDMSFSDKEYQYTLYYYDQAGNLVQTVAPKGVERFENNTPSNSAINAFRDATTTALSTDNANLVPNHKFKTEYQYNSLNQLVWQSTPDGGVTRFAYDALGRIIASQNAKQAIAIVEGNIPTVRFSYTEYDALGRISEAGQIETNPTYRIDHDGKLIQSSVVVNGFDPSMPKSQVTRTVYDEDPLVETVPTQVYASSLFVSNPLGYNTALNNRNRVTGVFYYENSSDNFSNAIFYNYDVHGNVKEVVNYYPYLKGDINCNLVLNATTGQLNDCEPHIKRVLYDYDLISGNVKQVTHQPSRVGEPSKKDLFIHKYEYDADNRIVNVQTSKDGLLWEKDANYKYYPHGPLSRVEIGDKNVQGIDYAYTLQGWLKMVNGENLDKREYDMNQDGLNNSVNKDAFGYSLNYFNPVLNETNLVTQGDYQAINNDTGTSDFNPLMFSRNATIEPNGNLFNGNISKMVTAMRTNQDNLLPTQVNRYTYDQLNRIRNMNSSSVDTSNNQVSPSYESSYSYDKNGNLYKLYRSKLVANGAPVGMDDFTYNYNSTNNQLKLINDAIADNVDDKDIDDQTGLIPYDVNDSNSHNYVYDAIGQLIIDRQEELEIYWRVDGKVKAVANKKTSKYISFEYDGLGNRIAKIVSAIDNSAESQNYVVTGELYRTYYSRDAQGNVIGVYKITRDNLNNKILTLNENHIYGSSRLGIESSNDIVSLVTEPFGLRPSTNSAKPSVHASSSLPPVNPQDLLHYALQIEPTTTATWSEDLVTDPSTITDEIELVTKFKLDPSLESAPDGEFFIGKAVIEQNDFELSNEFTEKKIIDTDFSAFSNLSNYTYVGARNGFCGFVRDNTNSLGSARINGEYSLEKGGYLQVNLNSSHTAAMTFGVSYEDDVDDNDPLTMRYQMRTMTITSPPSTPIIAFANGQQLGSSVSWNGKVARIRRSQSGLITFHLIDATNNEVQIGSSIQETPEQMTKKLIIEIACTSEIWNLSLFNNNSQQNINSSAINQVGAGVNAIASSEILVSTTKPNTFVSTNSTTNTLASALANKVLLGDGYVEREILTNNANLNTYFGLGTSNTNDLVEFSNYILPSNKYSFGQVVSISPLNVTNLNNPIYHSLSYINQDKIRIERKNNFINYQIVRNGVVTTLFSIPFSSTNPLYLKMLVTGNAPREFSNVKLVNYSSTTKTTVADLKVVKSGTGYTPKVTVSNEEYDFTAITNPYRKTTMTYNLPTVLGVTFTQMAQTGFDLKFNRLANGNGEFIVNNHSPESVLPLSLITSAQNPTITDQNVIGPGNFDICYFNYKFGSTGNIVASNLDFTSSSMDNPIVNVGEPSVAVVNPATPLKILGGCGGGGEPVTEAPLLSEYYNTVGDKCYELANHLGNVLVVINDKKIPKLNGATANYFNADILSYSDYYPFGSLVPGRHGSTDNYRYGFNGKEKDDEIKGDDNSYDFGARMYDPRVGRWFATDRMIKESLSLYQFGNNNPIIYVDKDGNDEFYFNLLTSSWEYKPASGKNRYFIYTPGYEDGKFEIHPHNPQAQGWTYTTVFTIFGFIDIKDDLLTSIAKSSRYTGLTDLIKINDPKLAETISTLSAFAALGDAIEGTSDAVNIMEGGYGLFKLIKNGKTIYRTLVGAEKFIIISKKASTEILKRIASGGSNAKSAIAELQVAKMLSTEGKTVKFLDPALDVKTSDLLVDGVRADVKRTSGIGKGFAGDLRSGYEQVGENGTLYIVRGSESKASLDVITDFVKGFQKNAGVKFNFKVIEESSLPSLNVNSLKPR